MQRNGSDNLRSLIEYGPGVWGGGEREVTSKERAVYGHSPHLEELSQIKDSPLPKEGVKSNSLEKVVNQMSRSILNLRS